MEEGSGGESDTGAAALRKLISMEAKLAQWREAKAKKSGGDPTNSAKENAVQKSAGSAHRKIRSERSSTGSDGGLPFGSNSKMSGSRYPVLQHTPNDLRRQNPQGLSLVGNSSGGLVCRLQDGKRQIETHVAGDTNQHKRQRTSGSSSVPAQHHSLHMKTPDPKVAYDETRNMAGVTPKSEDRFEVVERKTETPIANRVADAEEMTPVTGRGSFSVDPSPSDFLDTPAQYPSEEPEASPVESVAERQIDVLPSNDMMEESVVAETELVETNISTSVELISVSHVCEAQDDAATPPDDTSPEPSQADSSTEEALTMESLVLDNTVLSQGPFIQADDASRRRSRRVSCFSLAPPLVLPLSTAPESVEHSVHDSMNDCQTLTVVSEVLSSCMDDQQANVDSAQFLDEKENTIIMTEDTPIDAFELANSNTTSSINTEAIDSTLERHTTRSVSLIDVSVQAGSGRILRDAEAESAHTVEELRERLHMSEEERSAVIFAAEVAAQRHTQTTSELRKQLEEAKDKLRTLRWNHADEVAKLEAQASAYEQQTASMVSALTDKLHKGLEAAVAKNHMLEAQLQEERAKHQDK